MSLIKRMRRQYAWWWHKTGEDLYSNPTFDAPVLIKCRWDDEVSLQVAGSGKEVTARATVYVDRPDVDVDDLLALEPDKNNTTAPSTPVDSRVQVRKQIPNAKATEFLHIVNL